MGKKHFIHSNWNLKICHLRNINGIYNFLKITSFRCRPPVRMHSWNLLLRFLIDRCNISAGILWISSWILCFNSSRVLSRVVYTLFLRYPHKKKSQTDKSGDLGGQGTLPNLEITRLPNNSRTASIDCRAVCDVDPSCWNQVSWTCGKFLNSGVTKDCNIST